MIGANVGYYGDRSKSNPVVGEVYTGHLVVGVGYPPRGGVVHGTRVRLPRSTAFDMSQGGITCRRQRPGENTAIDATADPGARCVQDPLLQRDGTYWLGYRDLPQGNLFEIQFNLRSNAILNDEILTGIVDSEYGTLQCQVPIRVFPAPVPSNRLEVRVEPSQQIDARRPVNLTIVTEDTGNGARVDGVATIFNYTPDGRNTVIVEVPTNRPVLLTFYPGRVPHPQVPSGADMYTPYGRVNVPGYARDANAKIPFRWAASMAGF